MTKRAKTKSNATPGELILARDVALDLIHDMHGIAAWKKAESDMHNATCDACGPSRHARELAFVRGRVNELKDIPTHEIAAFTRKLET